MNASDFFKAGRKATWHGRLAGVECPAPGCDGLSWSMSYITGVRLSRSSGVTLDYIAWPDFL